MSSPRSWTATSATEWLVTQVLYSVLYDLLGKLGEKMTLTMTASFILSERSSAPGMRKKEHWQQLIDTFVNSDYLNARAFLIAGGPAF